MVSHEYPIIPSPAQSPSKSPDEPRDDEFPRPDKDEQHLPVERMLGYAPKKKRTTLKVALIALAVVVIGTAGWFALAHVHVSSKKTLLAASATTQAPAPKVVPSKPFSSTNLNLSFNYPETWNVVDNGDGKLTVTSPAMEVKNASGQNTQARVVVTMQPKQTGLPEFKSGNAVATVASQKVTYTQPTSDQRAQTYISFLNYAGSNSSGIDAIYVTGDNGYQQGQAIPEIDVLKTDPLITVAFTQCSGSGCASGTPLTIAPSEWSDTGFAKPITDLITSLAIQ